VGTFVAEGVRNARKHADPTRVAVKASVESGYVWITVQNDGIRPAAGDPGIGLRLLELDADQLGGSVTTTRLEEKWEVTLTLPATDLR